MKKNDQHHDFFETELNKKQNINSESFKTTDVNILLNRVRLDEKKSVRKKIIISFILLSVIVAMTVYFII
tara:strand:- start:85 stop:294 length:210 start_codon:yes stop_codon:yes gene_type:complete